MEKQGYFKNITEEKLEEIQKKIKYNFLKIEKYFVSKEFIFQEYNIKSIDEVVKNAPKYYPILKLVEEIYTYITNDKEWLKHFIETKNIDFDWNSYQLWKSGKDYYTKKYDETLCPTKWITEIYENLIEILKMLQILLYMEFYTFEEDFKYFLKKNPVIDYKMKANYCVKSTPSENIEVIFEVIDYLLKIFHQEAINTTYIMKTSSCMDAYRFIDKSEIFTLLKKKEFYVRYRLEFLKNVSQNERIIIPEEEDIIKVGENFLATYKGLLFTYNEYKKRLMEKYEKVKSKLKLP